jgi:hypothetical protein
MPSGPFLTTGRAFLHLFGRYTMADPTMSRPADTTRTNANHQKKKRKKKKKLDTLGNKKKKLRNRIKFYDPFCPKFTISFSPPFFSNLFRQKMGEKNFILFFF